MLACDFFHVDCAITPAPDLRLLRDRGQHPLRSCARRHQQSRRALDHPAGPQFTGRPRRPRPHRSPTWCGTVPANSLLRSTPSSPTPESKSEDSAAMPASERLRGTVRGHRQSRTHRPQAHLRPSASERGDQRVRQALQHPTAAPRTATPPTPATASPARSAARRGPPPSHPRRTHQRIPPRRIATQTSGRILEPHTASSGHRRGSRKPGSRPGGRPVPNRHQDHLSNQKVLQCE